MERSAQIKLKSQKSELNKVVAFVENICDEHNIFNNYYGNIVTAISEAFINAVEHGNKNDLSKIVDLKFEVQNDGFAFCITDQGDGFNANSIPDPTDFDVDIDNVGTGLFLINSLSDKVEFKDNGRQVCMKFLISSINHQVANRRVNTFKSYINQKTKHKELS